MSKTIEKQILGKIYDRGRGWAFSKTDFASFGSRESIDTVLHRLEKKGTVRRVIRGLYDYPRISKLVGTMGPSIDQVAHALARKFGWRIQPSGQVAQNLIGLSTQVPATYRYQSDGKSRSYQIGRTTLEFESTVLKDAGFKYEESGIIVQALKSLGKNHITPDTVRRIRLWLDPRLRIKVLMDTQTATGWVYKAIRDICRENVDG